MTQYEFSNREIRLLHNALSEYRERTKERGLTSESERAERLRAYIVGGSDLAHECFRLTG